MAHRPIRFRAIRIRARVRVRARIQRSGSPWSGGFPWSGSPWSGGFPWSVWFPVVWSPMILSGSPWSGGSFCSSFIKKQRVDTPLGRTLGRNRGPFRALATMTPASSVWNPLLPLMRVLLVKGIWIPRTESRMTPPNLIQQPPPVLPMGPVLGTPGTSSRYTWDGHSDWKTTPPLGFGERDLGQGRPVLEEGRGKSLGRQALPMTMTLSR